MSELSDQFPILELLQDCEDPPLAPEDVEELEILLEVRFPKEYAEFLLQYNGGTFYHTVGLAIPHPTTFVNTAVVQQFFGEAADGIVKNGIVQYAEWYADRLPEGYLPVADCHGDLIVLKLAKPNFEFQGVWYWDSSAMFVSEDEPSLYWLADTFGDFLSKLVYDVTFDEEEREKQPTFQAIERGAIGSIERYLADGGAVNARNDQGHSLLAAAASYRWPKIVQLLLAHGADPNTRDLMGRTPLHHAADSSIDSLKMLLAAGADPKARDNDGRGVLAGWSYRADQILRAHGAVE